MGSEDARSHDHPGVLRAGRDATGGRLDVGVAGGVARAAFAAMFNPLPNDVCPMPKELRRMYTEDDPPVLAALEPILIEHRGAVYRAFLALPLDF